VADSNNGNPPVKSSNLVCSFGLVGQSIKLCAQARVDGREFPNLLALVVERGIELVVSDLKGTVLVVPSSLTL
jgi:hypothetical protein